MSSSTSRTWRLLLNDKYSAFVEQGCELPSSLAGETSFVTHFEDLCRNRKEKNYTRLLVKLRYGSIDAFASAVDAALEHVPPYNLAAHVSGGIFCGCNAGVQLVHIVELLAELNSQVPHLSADIPRFPHEPTVQTPLQDIFRAYMDSLLCMVSYFLRPPSADIDPIQDIRTYIRDSAKKFEMGRETFEHLLEVAERNKARELPNTQKTTSDILLDGKNHPYDTQARFKPLRRLGWGAFGQVDEVEEVSTREVYARKQIQLLSDNPAATGREEEVRNEVRIMQKLTHQHIATVLFWLKEPGACSIFMKPAGDYDLRNYLESCIQDRYPTDELRKILPWFGCLLDALAFAHRLNVMHRDIKPSNILIKNNQVYLADFGLAKDFTMQATSRASNYSICGTPVYRAPEIRPDRPRGRQADVFSLGCVFSEMLTVCSGRSLEAFQDWRRAPSSDYDILAFRTNIPKVDQWLDLLKKDRPDSLRNLLVFQISSMLNKEPNERPSAQDSVNILMTSTQKESLFCPSH